MSSKVSPAEVRAAAAFLSKRGIGSSAVSPRKLAAASKEQGKSFRELIAFIMRIFQGQQDQASQRREVVRAAAGAQ